MTMPHENAPKEAKRLLDLTTHEFDGERWGNDTVVGTTEELLGEFIKSLESSRLSGFSECLDWVLGKMTAEMNAATPRSEWDYGYMKALEDTISRLLAKKKEIES